ncbi:helix-turn-helix domain-containing protein [Enterococcus gallinarum]|uniref:helix-turn-helix domain-containing protein n=1 Tax=Enterococcus gallinarum TaxID=1353 RepID=UPI002498DD92|nr:helix-turn-helix transcriptional regulator [Enterococcus gallinarum]GMG60154.1 hypothetical protein AH4_34940 [Enterococcus gallinarum]
MPNKIKIMLQLEINHLINAIENLRQAKHVSQKELCLGIMDPSTYSKIKKGELSLSLKDGYEFLSRLNASWTDVESLNLFTDPQINRISKKYNQLTGNPKSSLSDIEELFQEISSLDLKNSQLLRLYLLLKKYYSQESSYIPKIKPNEIESIFKNINISTILTSVDYKIIGDLTSEFSIPQLLELYPKLMVKDLEDFLVNPRSSKLYTLQGLSNIADIFIDNAYFAEAENILDNLKSTSACINSFFYIFMYHFLNYRLQFFKEENEHRKSKILKEFEDWINAAQLLFKEAPQNIEPFVNSFNDLKKSQENHTKIIFRNV